MFLCASAKKLPKNSILNLNEFNNLQSFLPQCSTVLTKGLFSCWYIEITPQYNLLLKAIYLLYKPIYLLV